VADSGPPCPDGDITKRSPDRVRSLLTRDPGAWPDGSYPAGWAASSNERVLFDNGSFSIVRRSDPVQLVLAGELDFPSIPLLSAALLDAADGSGVCHVDLADVYFCDLAALRTIIGLSPRSDNQQPPRWARSVALHNVPDHIERILRILGWDTAPGLTIDTGTHSITPQQ
jgi:ABC-type transporter Mla MlaB component